MTLARAAAVKNTRIVMEKVLSSIKSLATKAPETVVNVNEVSRIALGASIKGDLSSRTDIRVDGNVDGILYSEGRIVVGESALLSGSLLCRNLDLWGKMDGDLYIRDILSLKSSAVVNGNLRPQDADRDGCAAQRLLQDDFRGGVRQTRIPGCEESYPSQGGRRGEEVAGLRLAYIRSDSMDIVYPGVGPVVSYVEAPVLVPRISFPVIG